MADQLVKGTKVRHWEYGDGEVVSVDDVIVGIWWDNDVSGDNKYGAHYMAHSRTWAEQLERL